MLGLVITLAAATAPLPQGQGLTCVEGPAACEAAPVAVEDATPFEVTFATPAVIDCRREPIDLPLVLSTLVGECDGTPHDTSYRVSRTGDQDQEGPAKAVAPAPRERPSLIATVGGMPQRAPTLQLPDAPVLALVATPFLAPPSSALRLARDALELSTRFADPPDRPPRV
jgi:hypothetical protein